MRLTKTENTIARMVNGRVRMLKIPKIVARTMDSIKKLCGQRLDGRMGDIITVFGGTTGGCGGWS